MQVPVLSNRAGPELRERLQTQQSRPGGMVYSNYPTGMFEMSPEKQAGSPFQWYSDQPREEEEMMIPFEESGIAFWRSLTKRQQQQAARDWNDAAFRGATDYRDVRIAGAFLLTKHENTLTLFNREMWTIEQVEQ